MVFRACARRSSNPSSSASSTRLAAELESRSRGDRPASRSASHLRRARQPAHVIATPLYERAAAAIFEMAVHLVSTTRFQAMSASISEASAAASRSPAANKLSRARFSSTRRRPHDFRSVTARPSRKSKLRLVPSSSELRVQVPGGSTSSACGKRIQRHRPVAGVTKRRPSAIDKRSSSCPAARASSSALT